MTKMEKETLIRALELYQRQQKNKAIKAREANDHDSASVAVREANMAAGLMQLFRDLLDIPAGKIKIEINL